MPAFFKIWRISELLSISLRELFGKELITSVITWRFLWMSLAISISFILPSSGIEVILELEVILEAALMGLFATGPFFCSLI